MTKIFKLELQVPIQAEQFRDIVEFVDRICLDYQFPQKEIFDIQLAVEELIENINEYAYKEKKGPIELKIEIFGGNKVRIMIKDCGIPFNPFKSLEGFDIYDKDKLSGKGGYGIYFVNAVMDDIQYVRDGKWNIVTLIKQIPDNL